MAKIYLRKTFTGFEPDQEQDRQAVSKIAFGQVVEATIRRPRNILFHRKFFALMNLVFENQAVYDVFEDFLIEIKLKTGHYREHITTKGEIIYTPKSISFSAMDEMEFSKFYDKTLDIIITNFIPNTGKQDLIDAVLEFM